MFIMYGIKYHDSVKSLFQVVVNINCDLHQMSSTYRSVYYLKLKRVFIFLNVRKTETYSRYIYMSSHNTTLCAVSDGRQK